ncbi:MAG: ParA family protein, partial [Nanoarchaeota archaeon]
LILDMDAQGHTGVSLNSQSVKDMYSFLVEGIDYSECITHLGDSLDIITSNETLTKAGIMLSRQEDSEFLLREKIKEIKGYDYIILDCSPSLGLLNQNALLASNEAIIPTSMDALGYDSLKKIVSMIQNLNEVFKHDCRISRIIPTMYDRRLRTSKQILEKVTNDFYGVVTDPIYICSKLKEAPEKGKSIFKYAPNSTAAKDYWKIVESIIQEERSFNNVKNAELKAVAAKA